MSGGHFDYNQYRMHDICDSLERAIIDNDQQYSQQTLIKLKQALHTTKQAANMIQRIDWLLSGDDGEISFHERWNEEIEI